MRQHAAEEEEAWWRRLKNLADAGDVEGFMGLYADYLTWNNVLSGQRGILFKMVLLAYDRLKASGSAPPLTKEKAVA